MELQFDSQQEYQLQAIRAIVGLLEGQPRVKADLRFAPGQSSFAAVPNRLDLTETELLTNLQAMQRRNSVTPDAELKCLEDKMVGMVLIFVLKLVLILNLAGVNKSDSAKPQRRFLPPNF